MDEFEYVMVLISLILGLGLTQLLIGISNIIKNWSKVNAYLPHILCVVVVFGLHIQEWWVNYNYSKSVEEWKFLLFVTIVVSPIILFIMARLLFPTFNINNLDLRMYYMLNYRKFYLFGFIMAVFSIPHNLMVFDFSISDQYPQFLVASVLLIPVVYKTDKNWFHYGLSGLLFLVGLIFVIVINPSL